MRVTIKCTVCNKEIVRNQNSNNRYYCSKICENKYKTKDRVKTTCDNCGIEILVTKSQFEHAVNHFCSKECGWSSMEIGKVEVKCPYCNKSFGVK